ncbi:MAG: DinB family protein [Rubrivivax sp.]|nr:DinB family protein [Pyrinomonadaceae bacterium]
MTRNSYRKGAVGALMDEYERALSEIKHLVGRIAEDDFVRLIDAQTSDDDCRSIQTIISHVVRAGYGYAGSIRRIFSIPPDANEKKLLSRQESLEKLDAVVEYTVQTLDGRWEMTDDEIKGVVIQTGWGVRYDLEQLLEHAIVHVLRHRRQIEKFIAQEKMLLQSGV